LYTFRSRFAFFTSVFAYRYQSDVSFPVSMLTCRGAQPFSQLPHPAKHHRLICGKHVKHWPIGSALLDAS
jgi:hypothetical protein